MKPLQFITIVVLFVVLSKCFAEDGNRDGKEPASAVRESKSASHKTKKDEKPLTHGYNNGVNRLHEGHLTVTDNDDKPAVWHQFQPKFEPNKLIGDVILEIVWTRPSKNSEGLNYVIPELHNGLGFFKSQYPSERTFIDKTLKPKKFLKFAIPDTPYSFYIVDGVVAPYFYDTEKDVIWRLNGDGLAGVFGQITTIAATSKRIGSKALGGGNLVIDFSDQDDSPKIKYWIKIVGY